MKYYNLRGYTYVANRTKTLSIALNKLNSSNYIEQKDNDENNAGDLIAAVASTATTANSVSRLFRAADAVVSSLSEALAIKIIMITISIKRIWLNN